MSCVGVGRFVHTGCWSSGSCKGGLLRSPVRLHACVGGVGRHPYFLNASWSVVNVVVTRIAVWGCCCIVVQMFRSGGHFGKWIMPSAARWQCPQCLQASDHTTRWCQTCGRSRDKHRQTPAASVVARGAFHYGHPTAAALDLWDDPRLARSPRDCHHTCIARKRRALACPRADGRVGVLV